MLGTALTGTTQDPLGSVRAGIYSRPIRQTSEFISGISDPVTSRPFFWFRYGLYFICGNVYWVPVSLLFLPQSHIAGKIGLGFWMVLLSLLVLIFIDILAFLDGLLCPCFLCRSCLTGRNNWHWHLCQTNKGSDVIPAFTRGRVHQSQQ